jgi:hypothetical protein
VIFKAGGGIVAFLLSTNWRGLEKLLIMNGKQYLMAYFAFDSLIGIR